MTTTAENQPLLTVESLGVRLGGRTMIEELSFAIGAGELIVVRGPNGSGKTTLLRAILGELPHRGTIRLIARDGQAPRVGVVPQTFSFDPSLPITVADAFALAASRPAFLRRRVETRTSTALEHVGATSLAERLLGELSGGELRRVLLAHALAAEPDLLLLDEPASHLDDAGVERFDRLLLDLRQEHGLTMLAVVHGEGALVDAADRIVAMQRPEEAR